MYMTDQLVAAMNAYWSVALFTSDRTSDQCEVLLLNMILVGGKCLTFVLLNCFNCIFRHSKLELLTQFPASND